MKKFDGILFLTDLDGTLLKNDGTISKENIDAIEYFKKEGGKFTFVTGRMPFLTSHVYEKVNPNIAFGCINGGGLYDHKKQEYIWTKVLPHSVVELLECVDKNLPHIGIQVNTFSKIYFSKENSIMEAFREGTGADNLACAYHDVKEPLAKIIFGCPTEEDIEMVRNLLNSHKLAEEFDFIRSEKTLYEILPKNSGKGTALKKLIELFGIDREKTVAIGDYDNDISMFYEAKVGVAVSNACKDAKDAADYVTVSNEENAIARVIYDIEKGNIKL